MKRSPLLLATAALLVACSDADAPPPAAPTRAPTPVGEAPDPGPPAAPPACVEDDVAGSLAKMEGVHDVAPIACGAYVRGAASCFTFTFTQRVDHAKEDSPTFAQRARLVHRGCGAPTTIMDNGYEQSKVLYELEPSVAFDTNTVDVEHRYQGKSVPATKDLRWTALSVENGASDLHEIIVSLRKLYTGRWVSTGASKGGITAVYHRYLFPNDVDGTVAYVAPASRAREDAKYQERMDGGPFPAKCRDDVRAFQTGGLGSRRAAFATALQTQLGVPEPDADYYLEYILTRFDWGFWQYEESCAGVPAPTASDDAHVAYFVASLQRQGAGPSPAPSDSSRSSAALAYEWSWQHGFALQVGAHLAPFLRTQAVADSTNAAMFSGTYPSVPLPAYDGRLTEKVRDWVRASAERVVLVYGDHDPWSGGALDAPTQPSSGRFFAPTRGHGAQMSDLPTADRNKAMSLASGMYGAATQSRSSVLPGLRGLHQAFVEHEARALRSVAVERRPTTLR